MPLLQLVAFESDNTYNYFHYIEMEAHLAASTRGWKAVIFTISACVDIGAFDALIHHHASTLEEFSIEGACCGSDNQVLFVLKSCPRLQTFTMEERCQTAHSRM